MHETVPSTRFQVLRRYLAARPGKLAVLAAGTLVNVVLTTATPLLLGRFIDGAVAGQRGERLLWNAALFVGLTILNQLVLAIAGYFGEDIAWAATNLLRVDLTHHCLEQDLDFHLAHPAGELIERVDGDVATLGEVFSSLLFGVAANLLLVLGILGFTAVLDWRMFLVLITLTLASIVVVRRLQNIALPYMRRLREAKADLSALIEEELAATEDIISSGAEAYAEQRAAQSLAVLARRVVPERIAFRVSSSVLEIALALATAGVLGLGAVLLTHEAITIGTIFVVFQYTNVLSVTLFRITTRLDQANGATASLDRIVELFRSRSRIKDGTELLPAGPLDIVYDTVGFEYAPGRSVLHSVSFHLPAGQVLGVVGRTGSGKTTIARLLFRGYDVCGGAVRIGGIDVRDLRIGQLRRRIGVVTQDVQLLRGTLRDNVALLDQTIPDAKIVTVLEDLGLAPWFRSLPDGLDTPVTNGSLSAGQGQLLAFARVFLRDPDIVVFDEASSRLDPGTQRFIEHAVDRLLEGRTAVIIAHRLETLRRADLIMVLDQGAVLEAGSRTELLADAGSSFARMVAEVTR